MSSSCSFIEEQTSVETIFKNVQSSSSEEPPMEEWSSLIIKDTPPDSPKMALFKEGLYSPGSGVICEKYIAVSDSAVYRHQYYKYPCIKDPGILAALEDPEPKKIYGCDGQEFYLDLCKQMNVIPVRGFHRGLLEEVIDLRYYGVNPAGVRAMCLSLVNNSFVRRLDLTSNHLSDDACYHLGQLLADSFVLQELVLAGCRIKAEGMRLLVERLSSLTLGLLDVSKNDIGDVGLQHLALQITKGAVIKRLNLSYNNLTSSSASVLAEAIEGNNTMTHLDISWNKMFDLKGSNQLFLMLAESNVLSELKVSWNYLTTGIVLRKLLSVKTLRVLDLSNNRLSGAAAKAIEVRLRAAKNLHTLDLSHNPFTPGDAFSLVSKMRNKNVKLKNLLMDNVAVTKEFIEELNDIMSYSYRRGTTVTHGRVISDYTLTLPDYKLIIMRRIDYITTRATKKCKMDIALFFLQEFKERRFMLPRDLLQALNQASAPVGEELVDGLARAFPGPKSDKGGPTINIAGVVEYVKRLWPDKKLPPTPPPSPPLEPVVEIKKKDKKKKKK